MAIEATHIQILLCFVSFLSLPCYFVFILTIIRFVREPVKYRKYLSFYHLILSCSIADVLFVLNYYLFGRFLQWEWLPYDLGGDWWARLAMIFHWYIKYSQALVVLLIGVNRLYAILLPFKYLQWHKSSTIKLLCVQWLLPLLFMSPIVIMCDIGVRRKVNGTITGVIRNGATCAMPSFLTSTVVQLDIAVALMVMYGLMLWKIKKQNHQRQNMSTPAARRKNAEKRDHQKLAFSGAIISATMILAAFVNASFVVSKGKVGRYYRDVNSLSLMLFSLGNPFFILFVSKSIRTSFKITLKLIFSLKCPIRVVPNSGTPNNRVRAGNLAQNRM